MTSQVKPLASRDGESTFSEVWQAETLAMAEQLIASGVFSNSEWSAALGRQLADATQSNEVDNAETYYRCALKALEQLVSEHSEIKSESLSERREQWVQAYLSTPHGQPVQLKKDPQ